MVKGAAGPGVYSATYSNIPVYEFQFGVDLKEHVMRRRHDDWINATHILKAAGFDKPARTRILEREVQKELHEKVQGGYGKYQGTWVPLEKGEELAHRNGIYEKLRTIFEFVPGNDSPPPAPKHTTNKPKAPKKPAVPKFHSTPAPARIEEDQYDNISVQLNDDETPDDATVASASFMGEDDRYDISAPSTAHRKRKREEAAASLSDQYHMAYSDELLDYFMLAQASEPASRPEPPPNFQPDWLIDSDGHTALHWASAMGDIDVMKQLKRFGANLSCRNIRGETPLMRSVLFTNCLDKQSMPRVVQELISTIDCVDAHGATAIHHAVALTHSRTKHHCARYYLDVILNKLSETTEQDEVRRLLDLQDSNGDTACHISATNKARKCVRALIGRGASTDIPNNAGVRADELIQELNNTRRERNLAASSSPFAPDSQRQMASFHDINISQSTPNASQHLVSALASRKEAHHSEAAQSVSMKLMPLMAEKFMDLARSFDEELLDRENSEREAKRILQSSQVELATIQRQIHELGNVEEDDSAVQNEVNQLAHAQQRVVSLVEQQQAIMLGAGAAQEESMANGNGHEEGGVEGLAELLRALLEEQGRRQGLVTEYAGAMADVGMGEKGGMYRKLTAKCLGLSEEEVDERLDGLLGVLEEDGGAEE
ncbi:hypothetical protein V496_09793 [Pseudogymnoascus sp. VKM F-4515 (FW-2607)]|nr:hypothetical protein V496_09793 [Pseudogymnoascus sp. VKM F-4515 (FW-2607)]KFY92352.1 hypothetical protein V498_05031 [Pseudogymnoascus sp. VKM F-4517 (FW-2822)]